MKIYILQCGFLLYFYYHVYNIFFIILTVDNLNTLFVYLLNKSHICKHFLSSYSISLSKIPYSQKYHIRLVYYSLLYITNKIINFILYNHVQCFINYATILCVTPPIINIIFQYSTILCKKIDDIICITVAQICCYLLNVMATLLFNIHPKINYYEIKPYITTYKSRIKILQKCIQSFFICLLFIYIKNKGYESIINICKNIYHKDRNSTIENMILHRKWDDLSHPLVLNDIYFIYDKLKDSHYDLETQIDIFSKIIYKQIIQVYYIYYIYTLTNTHISISFSILLFHHYHPFIFFSTFLTSYVHTFYSIILSKIMYLLTLKNVYNLIKTNTIQYIIFQNLHYIDPCVYYLCLTWTISYYIGLWCFIVLNMYYTIFYTIVVSYYHNCENISFLKHTFIFLNMIVLGFLSNYNYIHVVSIPIIYNCYLYFLYPLWRYKHKKQPIVYIQNYIH